MGRYGEIWGYGHRPSRRRPRPRRPSRASSPQPPVPRCRGRWSPNPNANANPNPNLSAAAARRPAARGGEAGGARCRAPRVRRVMTSSGHHRVNHRVTLHMNKIESHQFTAVIRFESFQHTDWGSPCRRRGTAPMPNSGYQRLFWRGVTWPV